jgi:hypothetical protein
MSEIDWNSPEWKAQLKIVLPEIEAQSNKNEADITQLKSLNATEELRIQKIVRAVLRSGEFRLRNWVIIIGGLVTVAGTIYGALK